MQEHRCFVALRLAKLSVEDRGVASVAGMVEQLRLRPVGLSSRCLVALRGVRQSTRRARVAARHQRVGVVRQRVPRRRDVDGVRQPVAPGACVPNRAVDPPATVGAVDAAQQHAVVTAGPPLAAELHDVALVERVVRSLQRKASLARRELNAPRIPVPALRGAREEGRQGRLPAENEPRRAPVPRGPLADHLQRVSGRLASPARVVDAVRSDAAVCVTDGVRAGVARERAAAVDDAELRLRPAMGVDGAEVDDLGGRAGVSRMRPQRHDARDGRERQEHRARSSHATHWSHSPVGVNRWTRRRPWSPHRSLPARSGGRSRGRCAPARRRRTSLDRGRRQPVCPTVGPAAQASV